MGACHSRLERKEAVSRCKARRRYTKQLVKARRDFAAAHALYLRALRSTSAALLQFADTQSQIHHHYHHPPPPPPPPPPPQPPISPSPPPPPLSPISSISTSPIRPPPPPPHISTGWDFWDPFGPSSSRSGTVTEEEWEEVATVVSDTTTVTATANAAAAPPPSVVSGYSKESGSELAMVVVPRGKKDLSEIVKELDEYFLKAAEAGNNVSVLLEAPSCDFPINHGAPGKVFGYGKNLNSMGWSWGSNAKSTVFTRYSNGGTTVGVSHSSTVEKLYAWEKKLYLEVKSYERIKEEHEKRVGLLRKQEVKGADYVKIEKNRFEIERLESKMLVGAQAIETTSSEIITLRESELLPQLLQLVTGLTSMWRGMYECHQVQTHIVQHLQHLNANANPNPNPNPTSNAHREAALQLELETDRWHLAFSFLIRSQRDYVTSLTGWLRLSLFHSHHSQDPLSDIYSLCEEWQLAIDRIPDKVASDGIRSFLTMIHTIVVQQAEEQKQKKRVESAFRELEKKAEELRLAEAKHGPLIERRLRVESLKSRAEEERSKYEKSVAVTRAMTVNNFQTAFPNVFQAITGFSSVCMQAFEAVYNHQQNGSVERVMDLKRLLT